MLCTVEQSLSLLRFVLLKGLKVNLINNFLNKCFYWEFDFILQKLYYMQNKYRLLYIVLKTEWHCAIKFLHITSLVSLYSYLWKDIWETIKCTNNWHEHWPNILSYTWIYNIVCDPIINQKDISIYSSVVNWFDLTKSAEIYTYIQFKAIVRLICADSFAKTNSTKLIYNVYIYIYNLLFYD